MLAATRPGSGIAVWALSSKTILMDLKLGNYIYDAVFSRDLRQLAALSVTLGANSISKVAIFRLLDPREPVTIDLEYPRAMNMNIADDGTTVDLMAGEFNRASPPERPCVVQSWRTADGKPLPLHPMRLPPQDLVQFSSDKTIMIGANRNQPHATIWNTSTGEPSGKLSGSGSSTSNLILIHLSLDGKTVALGRQDRTLEVWDLASKTLRTTLRGHLKNFRPYRMQFVPDSALLISEAYDNPAFGSLSVRARYILSRVVALGKDPDPALEILVWDLRTGKIRAGIPGQGHAVLSEDGKRMATAGDPGTIRIWDLSKL